MDVTTIGFDIAKSVFQVQGVDAAEQTVVRKQLRRCQVLPFFRKQPPCLVGMDPKRTSHIKTQMPERSNATPGSG